MKTTWNQNEADQKTSSSNIECQALHQKRLALDLSVRYQMGWKWLWGLCLMGMICTDKNSEFCQHLTAQFVLWQHAANSFAQQLIRSFFPCFNGRPSSQTTRKAGVAIVLLLSHFGGHVWHFGMLHRIAGKANSIAIEYDHAAARINVSSVIRLMFAHQDGGDTTGQTAHNMGVGIDDIPFMVVAFLSGESPFGFAVF